MKEIPGMILKHSPIPFVYRNCYMLMCLLPYWADTKLLRQCPHCNLNFKPCMIFGYLGRQNIFGRTSHT